ncbi:hypothetical protein BCR32DRAFT_327929 [Anaeromyces robustus]|uniref:Uncharacterized protein n=1 Tax=Anaeromyces robustus TaxID=1754192 RepID=A0A1Y1X2A5_9FUNG|nr:hypothetical protein BCR32DRAFT_327929 [Anaeromyces robustus]|eukprot:ORX79832.1 hypothetical protein BCR32DRAFT_327929 [Anaeromyces robustus]
MKKIQEERIHTIEKESSEWKKTISDIEEQLASLKSFIDNTDGLFSDLFKKGKELELEIDTIKKKNIDFEKSHYKHIDYDDYSTETSDKNEKPNTTEIFEYFNDDKNNSTEVYENFNETTNNEDKTSKSDNMKEDVSKE